LDRDDRPETVEAAAVHAQCALDLDESEAYAHNSMGWVALRRRQFDLAGQHFERAVDLNPNSVNLVVDWANCLMYVGRLEEALRCVDLAMQQDSYPPTWIWEVRGQTLYFMKHYDEAVSALKKVRADHFWTPMFLAAAYAQLGRTAEAGRAFAPLLKIKPRAPLAALVGRLGYADQSQRDHLLTGLRKARLPE